MLASTRTILEKARTGKYAVGAFNINNMEIVQGVVNAAVRLKSPVILATSEGAVQYAGIHFLRNLAETAAMLTKIPIALHLDHGKDSSLIKQAIHCGYSSVMIDGSQLPLEKNIALTKKVVRLAHNYGVSVEAELGTIGGAEDLVSSRNIVYTNPLAAEEFVARTGCDFLAIAIGTSHGAYKFKGKVSLRTELIKEIQKRVKIPLVLHGASGVPQKIVREAEQYGAQLSGVQGVPDREIKQAIRAGISKVNTDTDLRIAFDAAVRKAVAIAPQDIDPRHLLAPAREAIQNIAEQRMKLFGSMGKA